MTAKKYMNEISLSVKKSDFQRVKITESSEAEKLIRGFFFDDLGLYESSFILLLNRANIAHGFAKISQGGISGTIIDPAIVAKYAVESLSKGVIICHNHPSGNLEPSPEDRKITERIKSGLALFDIKLLDHIILTEEGYSSFADRGII